MRFSCWLSCVSLVLTACSNAPTHDAPPEPLVLDVSAVPVQPSKVRAFYSGHSLAEGVPEAVAQIALSANGDFDYEFQNAVGSLIRERTKGADPNAKDWPGDRSGRNRNGSSMDVQAELRAPRTLQNGDRYSDLVVTERHDLPWSAFHEGTPRYLRHMIDGFAEGNPVGRVWLYHTWIEATFATPEMWIAYERDALRLWECVASATNAKLAADGKATRVHVLPGATALADLVESITRGDLNSVPGMSGTLEQRLQVIFMDGVHFAPAGAYFMGAVHYAALFGKSPEGSAVPAGIAPELALHMQRTAWNHVREYAKRSAAGATRAMPACRAFAAQTMCPAFDALRGEKPMSWLDRLRHAKSSFSCAGKYEDTSDPRNPFL